MADDPAAVRGIVVYLGTQFDGKDASGRAYTRTDDEGRFVIPALAEGSMLFMVPAAPGSPFRPAQGSTTQITANRENRARDPAQDGQSAFAARFASGARTDQFPGAGVLIGSQYQMNVIYSDSAGRFEDYVLPGTIGMGIYPWMAPRPFFPLARQPIEEIVVPANVTGIHASRRSSWLAATR